jgi:hypothetical protein
MDGRFNFRDILGSKSFDSPVSCPATGDIEAAASETCLPAVILLGVPGSHAFLQRRERLFLRIGRTTIVSSSTDVVSVRLLSIQYSNCAESSLDSNTELALEFSGVDSMTSKSVVDVPSSLMIPPRHCFFVAVRWSDVDDSPCHFLFLLESISCWLGDMSGDDGSLATLINRFGVPFGT